MYEEIIEPLYGGNRDTVFDAILKQNNEISHMYNVNERIDMTS